MTEREMAAVLLAYANGAQIQMRRIRRSGCWVGTGSKRAEEFVGFDPGECYWKDSLIVRPGVKYE